MMWKPTLSPSWIVAILFVALCVIPPTIDQEGEIMDDIDVDAVGIGKSFVVWKEETTDEEIVQDLDTEPDTALFMLDTAEELEPPMCTPNHTLSLWYRLLTDETSDSLPRRLLTALEEFSAHSKVVSLREFAREKWQSSSTACSNMSGSVTTMSMSLASGVNRSIRDHPVLLPSLAMALLLLVLITGLFWILQRRRRIKELMSRPRTRTLSDSIRNYNQTMNTTSLHNKASSSSRRPRLWTAGSAADPLMASSHKLNTRLLNQSSRDLIQELELEDPQQRVMMMQLERNNLNGSGSGEVQQQYYGPSVETIVYDTWTPPPSWGETSRKLLPQDTMRMQLAREISLSLGKAEPSICIREPYHPVAGQSKRDRHSQRDLRPPPIQLPVSICSVHPKPPTDGGVLELYVKDSPREEWMEHTFGSAHAAAQFQMDLLAMQLLGDTIHHMYQALKIVHQGSAAHAGKEFVLHDRVCEEETVDGGGGGDDGGAGNTKSPYVTGGGVAWDDVMRCLGSSFPAINWKLETLWWREKVQSDTAAASASSPRNLGSPTEAPLSTDSAAVASGENGESANTMQHEYFKKRVLLGPVDFFRLFVPNLPEMEVPRIKSTRARMERMLRWRKRVARASVLVQSYTRARIVANLGWHLNRTLPANYLKTRLAYDDTNENSHHDATVENEIYEATVSRDIICHVRSPDYLRRKPWWLFGLSGSVKPARSGYQGFTLVGSHVFKLPPEGVDHPFTAGKDPVLALPSLRAIIEAHPEQEFFVSSMILEAKRTVAISFFVRSLPVGIDPKFDTVVNRYVFGDEEIRNRKLELLLQLGKDRTGLPVFSWVVLRLLSFLLRWTVGGGNVPQPANVNDCTPIPAIKVAHCGEIHHFGGSLQSDRAMPLNYVAYTLRINSRRKNNFATRILMSYFEDGGLSRDVVDFTFILAGETEDELPERALATCRKVHNSGHEVALPVSQIMSHGAMSPRNMVPESPGSSVVTSSIGLYFRIFVTDPAIVALSPLTRLSLFYGNSTPKSPKPRRRNELARAPTDGIGDECDVVTSNDPFEKAVNELVEIFEDVSVPVRKSQMAYFGSAFSPLISNASIVGAAPILRDDLVQVSILRRINRSDIRRYFVAADCVLKNSAVRIVESAAWRGLTFPIDTRTCRIELQNGMFFQSGKDLEGNPVFYFQNTLLGPWRKDEDAVISAVLHRLETSLNEFAREDPEVKCTLIISMGKPFRREKKKQKVESDGSATGDASADLPTPEEEGGVENSVIDGETIDYEEDASLEGVTTSRTVGNPRIHSDEQWHTHTTKQLIRRMIDIVTTHYPERLSKALVVVGKGNTAYTRTAVGGILALPKVLSRQRTREKVKFLIRYADLQEYVAKEELPVLVGGTATVNPRVYECL